MIGKRILGLVAGCAAGVFCLWWLVTFARICIKIGLWAWTPF